MIRTEHFPTSIPFFDNGRIQLTDSEHLTLPDVVTELSQNLVYGFKIFDMLSDESVRSSYGFLYYPTELDGDIAQEVGNLIMSKLASQFEDQFLTPPKSLKTNVSIEILLHQSIQHLKQISFIQEEKTYRLTLCIFKSNTGLGGHV